MRHTCEYWDCGWCYAPDNVGTNADASSACVNPSFCPYLGRTDSGFQTNIKQTIQPNGGQLMSKQITLEEALSLASFYHTGDRGWQVLTVKGDIHGTVLGNIYGAVCGNVGSNIWGYVRGNVYGDVDDSVTGTVKGRINGRKWEFVETPKEKLQRLIERTGNQELIEAFNKQENN